MSDVCYLALSQAILMDCSTSSSQLTTGSMASCVAPMCRLLCLAFTYMCQELEQELPEASQQEASKDRLSVLHRLWVVVYCNSLMLLASASEANDADSDAGISDEDLRQSSSAYLDAICVVVLCSAHQCCLLQHPQLCATNVTASSSSGTTTTTTITTVRCDLQSLLAVARLTCHRCSRRIRSCCSCWAAAARGCCGVQLPGLQSPTALWADRLNLCWVTVSYYRPCRRHSKSCLASPLACTAALSPTPTRLQSYLPGSSRCTACCRQCCCSGSAAARRCPAQAA